MDVSAIRVKGRSGLGLWICGPLLALVAILYVAAGLPGVECGEGGGASDGEMTLFVALVALASGAALAAAAVRLVALWRRPDPRGPLGSRLLLAAPLLLVAAVLLIGLLGGAGDLIGAALVLGQLATGAALLALLVAWALGRGVDDVGVLLPLYLLGAGLISYPAVLVLVAVGQSGSGC